MTMAKQQSTRNYIAESKIEQIVYATDLESVPDEALDYAIMLASTFSANLTLCHSVNKLMEQDSETSNTRHLFEKEIGFIINPNLPPELKWQGVVTKAATAAKGIIDEAIRQKADLIVMRSRRRPLASSLLGSTTEVVCHNASCPILVTHPLEREWIDSKTDKVHIDRILVATDFSEHARLALSYALTLAKAFQSELQLVHVVNTDSENGGSPIFGNRMYLAKTQMDRLISEIGFNSDTVKATILTGKSYSEILTYTKENPVDLICIGAHGEGFHQESFFGSNADLIVRHATCPILVAR